MSRNRSRTAERINMSRITDAELRQIVKSARNIGVVVPPTEILALVARQNLVEWTGK